MIKCGPYTTAGVYESYIGSVAFNSLDLIISGTANADVHYDATGSGTWTAYSSMTGQTASANGTYLYAVSKIRVTVNSINPGSSVTAYVSGIRDSK